MPRKRRYTLEDIQNCFRLEGELVVRAGGRRDGQPATFSTNKRGYRYTRIRLADGGGTLIREHIIKVTLHLHVLPEEVDHIDGDPSNNELANLRSCTHAENMRNQRPRQKASGLPRGVFQHGSRFQVTVGHGGKLVNGGTYPTPEQASRAAVELRAKLHGEYARHG